MKITTCGFIIVFVCVFVGVFFQPNCVICAFVYLQSDSKIEWVPDLCFESLCSYVVYVLPISNNILIRIISLLRLVCYPSYRQETNSRLSLHKMFRLPLFNQISIVFLVKNFYPISAKISMASQLRLRICLTTFLVKLEIIFIKIGVRGYLF